MRGDAGEKQNVIKLKYGKTNTYLVGGLLIDTDYAGTLSAFYKEIKKKGAAFTDIQYVFATHYHPDHIGLISELMELGVKLLLMDHQIGSVHASDAIFQREPWLRYKPIEEKKAVVIRCEESRDFLYHMGIRGEIVPTASHSGDSAAVILDDGSCFVGDLEPMEFIGAYENNRTLQEDWKLILSRKPITIYYGHANEQRKIPG